MSAVLDQSKNLLLNFAAKAAGIFSTHDAAVIQRRKKTAPNIDSEYICQFTIELLTRQPGGFKGAADRLSEILDVDSPHSYSASSICDARKKFSPKLFLDLNQALIKEISLSRNLWQGRRLFAIDGSKIVLPKELEKEGFKKEKAESHYPIGLVSCLYEVETQLIHDASLTNHCDERMAAIGHFSKLSAEDIILYDRGYFSFNLLAAHRQKSHDFIMRIAEKTGVKELEAFIQENTTQKSAEKVFNIAPLGVRTKQKLTKEYPAEEHDFLVRMIKYTHEEKPYYLLTSLLNKNLFPKKIFPDLYHSRWSIEEAYKQLKVYLLKKMFHGKCYVTIRHELYASILVANMSRALTLIIEDEKNVSKKKLSTWQTEFEMAGQQIIRSFCDDSLCHFALQSSEQSKIHSKNQSDHSKNFSPWTIHS